MFVCLFCYCFRAKVIVHYDVQFWRAFGKGSLNRLRTIVNLAQNMFQLPGLGTEIELDIQKEYVILTKLRAPDSM